VPPAVASDEIVAQSGVTDQTLCAQRATLMGMRAGWLLLRKPR
jgi:hypothetical protein